MSLAQLIAGMHSKHWDNYRLSKLSGDISPTPLLYKFILSRILLSVCAILCTQVQDIYYFLWPRRFAPLHAGSQRHGRRQHICRLTTSRLIDTYASAYNRLAGYHRLDILAGLSAADSYEDQSQPHHGCLPWFSGFSLHHQINACFFIKPDTWSPQPTPRVDSRLGGYTSARIHRRLIYYI